MICIWPVEEILLYFIRRLPRPYLEFRIHSPPVAPHNKSLSRLRESAEKSLAREACFDCYPSSDGTTGIRQNYGVINL